jgi:hypothetical protein
VLLLVSVVLVGGEGAILAEQSAQEPQAPAPAAQTSPKLSGDQLESLVAPIALYPDDLLAQCLVASTYPVEVVQAQQWVEKNSNLKGDALSQAAMKQDWDPSIQALTGIPDALKMLSQDIKWTVDLGNAFLAQQPDIMDAVQRLRAKAKDGGKLETTEQQTVTTKVIEQKQIVVIEQASPEVVYVPSYSPAVIWGAPPYYPYPPLYYPPYYGGYWLGWGVGIAIGIGIAGGWGCGWGNNTININNNNNFNRNEISHHGEGNRGQGNRGEGNRGQGNRGQGDRAQAKNGAGNRGEGGRGGGNSTWQHNPSHRGGAPYGDRATASQFGGETRGQREARTGGAQASTRDALSRGSAGGGRTGSDRGGAGASQRAGAGGAGGRSGGSSVGGGGGGGDRVGNRSVSRPGNSGTGFSGSGGGNRGASASRSRGSSSFSGGGRGGGGGGGRRR